MDHTGCKRGVLDMNMVFCETASTSLSLSPLTYIVFEESEVETFGKGKPFKRMEKVEKQMSYGSFVAKFRLVQKYRFENNRIPI